jgi:hypothetical protein
VADDLQLEIHWCNCLSDDLTTSFATETDPSSQPIPEQNSENSYINLVPSCILVPSHINKHPVQNTLLALMDLGSSDVQCFLAQKSMFTPITKISSIPTSTPNTFYIRDSTLKSFALNFTTSKAQTMSFLTSFLGLLSWKRRALCLHQQHHLCLLPISLKIKI